MEKQKGRQIALCCDIASVQASLRLDDDDTT